MTSSPLLVPVQPAIQTSTETIYRKKAANLIPHFSLLAKSTLLAPLRSHDAVFGTLSTQFDLSERKMLPPVTASSLNLLYNTIVYRYLCYIKQ
jgi:hypothetical protein